MSNKQRVLKAARAFKITHEDIKQFISLRCDSPILIAIHINILVLHAFRTHEHA